jgi:hypothetical protein
MPAIRVRLNLVPLIPVALNLLLLIAGRAFPPPNPSPHP